MLIRFAKRLSAWEGEPDVTALKQTEFKHRNGGVDLRPSVYKLDDERPQHIQAYAEHAHRIDPPSRALGIGVVAPDRSRVVCTPGDTPFAFTRNNHHEVELNDESELADFIEAAKRARNRLTVQKSEVQDYVKARLLERDAEWVAHAESGAAKPWVTKLLPDRAPSDSAGDEREPPR